ncbi:13653_t:CDS:2 [Acaulospora colombiana]|uniref:13653_t:CDS:1 n=1 Tax=Acaulospora colombiana TaxID=27376 RepID=A0ACA9NNQ7_9GLOM|nr:13653_t:CDS:2 [Acaulospora colombiana]
MKSLLILGYSGFASERNVNCGEQYGSHEEWMWILLLNEYFGLEIGGYVYQDKLDVEADDKENSLLDNGS